MEVTIPNMNMQRKCFVQTMENSRVIVIFRSICYIKAQAWAVYRIQMPMVIICMERKVNVNIAAFMSSAEAHALSVLR